MIEPRKMELPTSPQAHDDPSLGESNWERFYRQFRKPGYIHGYEIKQKLGGGVFGIVFKARKESIGKAYAIKFLRVEDPSVRKQVLNELETVSLFAQVDHPNLVTIEDKGLVDGIPYIIMGFAGDETLKSRLQEGRLDQEKALDLMKQVLHGVKALHDHGLAHFDLKPANIFLHGELVRVGDYGLSKLIRESCSSLSFGRGTPYYMAPEMLRRKGDQRSDIYSLGVIFFECLTGKVPFEGENEWEVLKAHEEREVAYPPEVPEAWRPILSRMLAKDPEARVQDLREVLEFFEGQAVTQGFDPGSPPLPHGASHSSLVDPSPFPLPTMSVRMKDSFARVMEKKRKRSSRRRAGPAVVVGLLLGMAIALRGVRAPRLLGLGGVVAFGLFLLFLVQVATGPERRERWRRERSRFRTSAAISTGWSRLRVLLIVLLGFFMFASFFGFVFLGAQRSSFGASFAQRSRIEVLRAEEARKGAPSAYPTLKKTSRDQSRLRNEMNGKTVRGK